MKTEPIDINVRRPEYGQAIIGESKTGKWVEYWDPCFPTETMTHWKDCEGNEPDRPVSQKFLNELWEKI